jgi:hypothetical protein
MYSQNPKHHAIDRWHPKHHAIVDRQTKPSGKDLRVILLQDGQFEPLIEYFTIGDKRKLSRSWQIEAARSIGMFLDFVIELGSKYQGKGRAEKLFWDWVDAVEYGTIADDGTDQSGLYWPPHTEKQARDIAMHVKDFSDHCAKYYGAEILVPEREATLAERIAIYNKLDYREKNSFLNHLSTGSGKLQKAKTTNDLATTFSNSGKVVGWSEQPRFRYENFSKLISEGFIKYGGKNKRQPHLKWHIRDMMISILQGAGGCRESEPFHLYIDDVVEDRLMPGHASVKLFHPSEGKYTYYNEIGQLVTTTRMQYLRSIHMTPRHLSSRKNYHAGWKNLALYKHQTGEVYAPVVFFPLEWGRLFWDLFNPNPQTSFG